MTFADAVTCMNAGNRNAAVPLIDALTNAADVSPDQLQALLHMAVALGHVALVRKLADRIARQTPDKSVAAVNYAGSLARMGQLEEAYKHVRQHLKNSSPTPPINHFLGTYFMQTGDTAKAEKHLRKALAAWPLAGSSWLTLANVKHFEARDKDTQQLVSLAPQVSKTAPENQGAFFYALAKALRDGGETAGACDAYQRGAAAMRQRQTYDGTAESQRVDTLVRGFNPDFIAEQRSRQGYSPSTSQRAIFVVGLPRSGSTLVEQILCAHPKVADGAELDLVESAMMPFRGLSAENVSALQAQAGDAGCVWETLATTYLQLLEDRFGDKGRIVDKTLSNSRLLGHILLAMPEAKIIWMHRSPRDNAWSIYKSFFSQGVHFGWHFEDIAHYMQQETRLASHWGEVFPDAILPIQYESLVQEPDKIIAEIADFTGLPVAPQMQHFHRNRRAVITASATQVRKPLNRHGIGAYRRYEPHVPELANFSANET